MDIFGYAFPFITILAMQGILLATVIFLVVRRPSVQAYIMVVGVALKLIAVLFNTGLNFWRSESNMGLEEWQMYSLLAGLVGAGAAMLFAIGLLLFLHDTLRKRIPGA